MRVSRPRQSAGSRPSVRDVKDRRATGTLERMVLEQLWLRPEGATPREVKDALGEDLAYTTVMTILARLWKKGLAERELSGRAFRYRALRNEAELAATTMQAALEPVDDRSMVLSRFVDGLSEADEQALRKILEELDR